MRPVNLAWLGVGVGLFAAAGPCTASDPCTTPSATPKPPIEELVRASASAPNVHSVDASVTINEAGGVAFSGTDSGNFSQLFVITAPGQNPVAVSGNMNSSVNYSGAALNHSATTMVASRQRISGAPPTYLIRQWAFPSLSTSVIAGSDATPDFDSGQNVLSMNASGVVGFYGLVGGSTSTRLFAGTSRPPTTIATFNSLVSLRPQISDSGEILIRDNLGRATLYPSSGVGPPEIVASSAAQFGGFTGLLIRPGVAPDGNAVGFIANRGNGVGVFVWIRTNNSPVYQAIAGDGASDGFTTFPDDQRVGVTSTDLESGVRRVDVVFSATRTINAQTSSGVFVSRVQVKNGVVDQVTPPALVLPTGAQSAGPLQGTTVSSVSLSEPINRKTQLGILANLSSGQSVVRLNPCGLRPASAQPVFPKYKQYDLSWSAKCLISSYGQAAAGTCSCRTWSGAADPVAAAKCTPPPCAPGSFGDFGCTITAFSTAIAKCMVSAGAASGFPTPLTVQQQLFANRLQNPCRGTVDAGSMVYTQSLGGGTLQVFASRGTANDFKTIVADVKSGFPVILAVPRMSTKPSNTLASLLADGGGVHFIVAYGYEPTGGIGEASNILINDPGYGCSAYGQAGEDGNVLGFNDPNPLDSAVHVTLADYFAAASRVAFTEPDYAGCWGSDPIRDDYRIQQWFNFGLFYVQGDALPHQMSLAKWQTLVTRVSWSLSVSQLAPVVRVASPVEVALTDPGTGIRYVSSQSIAGPGDVLLSRALEPVVAPPENDPVADASPGFPPYVLALPNALYGKTLQAQIVGIGTGNYVVQYVHRGSDLVAPVPLEGSISPGQNATGTFAPTCPGDFNGSGSVTVQDIFDFLGAYFAGDPRADFNHSGVVTVQDIFDFLAVWFVPCH